MRISSALLCAVTALVAAGSPAQNQGGTFVNGSNGSLEVPYASSLMSPSGLTVEAWVTYDGSTLGSLNRFPTIVRGNIGSPHSYALRVNAGSTNQRVLRWAVRTQNAGVVRVDWNFAPGQFLCWTHVAATYDGVESKLFVNGTEVASLPGGGPIVDSGGSIGIGEGARNATFHNEVWNGQLDEVRIWSTSLTASQLRNLMFTPITTLVNLEAVWPLDGNGVDASGNGHNATVFGSITYGPVSPPVQFEYQTNNAAASFDINGALGTEFCSAAAVVPVGQPFNVNLASTQVGAPFDVAVAVPELLRSRSNGAPATAGTQIVNVDVTSPGLFFLNGGSLANPFGGSFAGNVTLPFTVMTPLSASGQMIVLSPVHFDGFILSAGADLTVQ